MLAGQGTSREATPREISAPSPEVRSTLLRPAGSYTLQNNGQRLPQSLLVSSFSNIGKPPKKKHHGNKKHCNCNKSQCLKLYCDCFANGEFCTDCNCKDCHNNLAHETERSRAIKASLDRNPHAFKPKIGMAPHAKRRIQGVASKIGKSADLERLHQKGCHCKKSNCLKNYCECYEAKVPCTERCKCCSCRNTEEDRSVRFKEKFSAAGLAQLAAAAVHDARVGTPESDEELDVINEKEPDPKSQPWFYMTDEIIQATTNCMVSFAHESETNLIKRGLRPDTEEFKDALENQLLHEFSRCFGQIMQSAKLESSSGRHPV